jgi:hypothetical protein
MRAHRLVLATLMLAAAPAAAKGPPWISIEVPANPFDRDARGAFLVVHTYHHQTAVQLVMEGTAEGLVNGARRSVPLELTPMARTGSFALTRTWPSEGAWVLDIRAFDGNSRISAVVGVGATGEVSFVRVPLARSGAPRTISRAEVETMLASLAAGRTPPPLAAAGWSHPAHRLQGLATLALFLGLGGAAVAGVVKAVRRKARG